MPNKTSKSCLYVSPSAMGNSRLHNFLLKELCLLVDFNFENEFSRAWAKKDSMVEKGSSLDEERFV